MLSALLLCTTALGAEKISITVDLTVPDSAWAIIVEEVHKVNNEIWVISRVSRDPDMMAAQVITTVRDTVEISAAELPLKHLVIGKTWGWKNEEPYTFINDLKQFEEDVKSGKLLYKRAE